MSEGNQRAALAFAAIAVAAIIYVLVTHKSDNGVTCAATAAGVGIVAHGLQAHDSAPTIVAAASAEFLLADKCDDWVQTLVDDPTKSTTLEVHAANGETVTTPTSGAQLPTLRPAQPPSTVSRMVACRGYTLEFFWNLCLEGKLAPIDS
jgi:hypothetical protein